MSNKPKILVVDDEPSILTVMVGNLSKKGYMVHTADDGIMGLEKARCDDYDTIIVDYMMPGMTGMELLVEIKKIKNDVPVIIVTAHGSIEQAVSAMNQGAFSYLTKPLNYEELFSVVRNAVQQSQLIKEVKSLRSVVNSRYSFDNIIGSNAQMLAIFDLIEDVAQTDATVLIRGETGTGKELIARAIHYNSPRKNETFVRVNCAALTETLLESELFGHEKGAFTGALTTRIGRFEQAHGGTLFLDEIGDISLSTQSKLLRALQEREFERVGSNQTIAVDVRIISASNNPLEKSVADGRFREDLFYRLNVIPIQLPPLRERVDDIPLLAFHFLQIYSEKFKRDVKGIDPRAIQYLIEQDWPGNIRQLENVIERAVIREKGDKITFHTISKCVLISGNSNYQYFINEEIPFGELKNALISKFEREYIDRVLKKHKGNITAAARQAGIHYKNFCEKMKKHEIGKWDYKSS